MSSVNLVPLAKTEQALLSYLDTNFRRIADALDILGAVDSGINTFTGAIVVSTTLAEVKNVIVSLVSAPIAGACFVRGSVVGSGAPKDIDLRVYSNTFAQATIAASVAWVAIGV